MSYIYRIESVSFNDSWFHDFSSKTWRVLKLISFCWPQFCYLIFGRAWLPTFNPLPRTCVIVLSTEKYAWQWYLVDTFSRAGRYTKQERQCIHGVLCVKTNPELDLQMAPPGAYLFRHLRHLAEQSWSSPISWLLLVTIAHCFQRVVARIWNIFMRSYHCKNCCFQPQWLCKLSGQELRQTFWIKL